MDSNLVRQKTALHGAAESTIASENCGFPVCFGKVARCYACQPISRETESPQHLGDSQSQLLLPANESGTPGKATADALHQQQVTALDASLTNGN